MYQKLQNEIKQIIRNDLGVNANITQDEKTKEWEINIPPHFDTQYQIYYIYISGKLFHLLIENHLYIIGVSCNDNGMKIFVSESI